MLQRDDNQALVKRARAGVAKETAHCARVKPAPASLTARKSAESMRKGAKLAHAKISERTVILDELAERYERLVSVLCDAAKNGCAPRLELEYVDIRRWMLERSGALQTSTNATVRLARGATDAQQAEVSIEQIVRPATLGELLANDSGELIERVSKVSEAVFDHRRPFLTALPTRE